MADDDYETGFGKPPKKTRFRKGQSGNPKGRPKGARNFKSDVLDALSQPISVTENGKRKAITSQKALILRLREKALKGDARALDRLLELARIYNGEKLDTNAGEAISVSDEELISLHAPGVLKRLRNATREDPALDADQHTHDGENSDE